MGIVIDTDQINLLICRGKVNFIFLHARTEQLNAFYKLCKDFYYLALTSVNSGLNKGNQKLKQTRNKKRQDAECRVHGKTCKMLKEPRCIKLLDSEDQPQDCKLQKDSLVQIAHLKNVVKVTYTANSKEKHSKEVIPGTISHQLPSTGELGELLLTHVPEEGP